MAHINRPNTWAISAYISIFLVLLHVCASAGIPFDETKSGEQVDSSGNTVFVVPAKDKHTATVIFLHGLGLQNYNWYDLGNQLSPQMPHVKWLFPIASKKRLTAFKGVVVPHWYDLYKFPTNTEFNQTQANESAAVVSQLIDSEITDYSIPSNRIALTGYSQGGGIDIIAGYTSPHELAAIAILSGAIPFFTQLNQPPNKANFNTPIWMGYGDKDSIVNVTTAQKHRDFLTTQGYKNVTLQIYPGLTHTYGHFINNTIVADFSNFLKRSLPVVSTGSKIVAWFGGLGKCLCPGS